MTLNINSEAYCRMAYLNYHCYGNTMGLTAEDMGKITQAWPDRISSWQATVADDENEYDFDDSDYANYKAEGKEAAQKATGHDGSKGIGRGIVDATASAAGAVISTVGTKVLGKAAEQALNKIGTKLMGKAAEKALEKTGAEAVKGAGKKALENCGSWSVAAPLALANATAYMAKKPNKDQVEACNELQTEMQSAQSTLADTQCEMESMSDEIITLSDEALTYNEEANEEIEEQKTEYDSYFATYTALKEKAASGTPLSDSEKELYKSVVGYLTEMGVLMEETVEDTSDEIGDLYDEIATFQEGYDATAETMGEIEGLTDFAESFDKATKTMCYVEAISQGINAITGTKAAIKAGAAAAASLGFNAWAWACVAMGASAAAMSGIGANQQLKWAGEVGAEIEMREATQDLHSETMDIYTENIDAYDGYMQGIEELELEIPDEIEPPEETELPNTSTEPTGEDAVPEVLKPKKEKEGEEEA